MNLPHSIIDAHFQTLTTFPPRNFQREVITQLLHHQTSPSASHKFRKNQNSDRAF